MTTVKIHDILKRRVLVTRESAKVLKPILSAAVSRCEGKSFLDFSGIAGVTPSFIDETLAIIEEVLQPQNGNLCELEMLNFPSQLSPQLLRAGKRHGLLIRKESDTALIISKMKG